MISVYLRLKIERFLLCIVFYVCITSKTGYALLCSKRHIITSDYLNSRKTGEQYLLTKGDNNNVDDRRGHYNSSQDWVGIYNPGQDWVRSKEVVGRVKG